MRVTEEMVRAACAEYDDGRLFPHQQREIMRRCLEKALALQDDGWRSMDSAPRDGTYILAYAADYPGNYWTTWWIEYRDEKHPAGWFDWEPDAWQPLPSPPKED